MRTLKLPTWEDEYDTAVKTGKTEALIPATPFWIRRLAGPRETLPTEVTYYRGLTSPGRPRRCITAPVTDITLDNTTHPHGAPFGVFRITHAALDAANEKTETV